MKLRLFLTTAAVGVGLISLFAPAAGAKEPGLTFCENLSPKDQAYLEDPARTPQEIQAAWTANEAKYCVTAIVPAGEDALKEAETINLCLDTEGLTNFTKADVEHCIAEWRGDAHIVKLRHAKRKHRAPRHHRAHRHARR